jgi:tetratricopeptide (TPR) repeat protein
VREVLGDPGEATQALVIGSLGALRDRQSVPRLIELLQSPDSGIRRAAVDALGKIGDPAATWPLVSALNDEAFEVRYAAVFALGDLGDSQALDPVRRARQSAKGLWRWSLGKTLRKLERGSSRDPGKVRSRVLIDYWLTAPEMIALAAWWAMRVRVSRRKQCDLAVYQGWRLIRRGHEQEALEVFEKAVQQFPEDAGVQLSYGTILLTFRPDEVVAEVSKAVELGPDNPAILVRAAHLAFDRGERDLARTWTARANEVVQPDFVLMSGLEHLNALFAGIDGEYDVAEEKLRSIVQDDPEFFAYPRDLARLLVFRGRQAEAIAVLDAAMERVKDKHYLEELRAKIVASEAE